MTFIESVTLEVPDTAAADAFYTAAFGLDDRLALRASDAPTTGFRAFTLSLVVSQPATVDGLIGAAVDAGATALKPAKKSFWGYGGVIQAPDGTIWKVATSSKKDRGPATRDIDELVLLLGVEDVVASKWFYADRGLEVAKSFGRKYVQFDTATRQAGALRSPRAGQGRRHLPRRQRLAPTRRRQRCRLLHRPGRLRVGTGGRRDRGVCDRAANLIRNRPEEIPMSPKKDAQKSTGFTAEERAAMKERARELKAQQGKKADGESDVLAKIAEMSTADRTMAKRLHEIVKASAPDLAPRTWYGMPAYAKDDKVVCFFQSGEKFKTRYATLGFSEKANLDEGAMWPTAFALKEADRHGGGEDRRAR